MLKALPKAGCSLRKSEKVQKNCPQSEKNVYKFAQLNFLDFVL